MRRDPVKARLERHRQLFDKREAQIDRWLGWIFTAAFFVLLVIVALGVAAARWLWVHAS